MKNIIEKIDSYLGTLKEENVTVLGTTSDGRRKILKSIYAYRQNNQTLLVPRDKLKKPDGIWLEDKYGHYYAYYDMKWPSHWPRKWTTKKGKLYNIDSTYAFTLI